MRLRVPRKVTVAPLARSSSATAMAGTTCPAVPPAAMTTLGTCSRAPFTPSRFPVGHEAQFASGPGRFAWAGLGDPSAGGDVEHQTHAGKADEKAAVAIGDEGQRDAGQRGEAHHGEQVDHRLAEDQGGEAGDEQLAVAVLGALRDAEARV